MTQKETAKKLIGLTLYKNQEWYPEGTLKNKSITLSRANTLMGDSKVVIDFELPAVFVDGTKQRLPKELRTDLLSIVRLKIAKRLKHAKFN